MLLGCIVRQLAACSLCRRMILGNATKQRDMACISHAPARPRMPKPRDRHHQRDTCRSKAIAQVNILACRLLLLNRAASMLCASGARPLKSTSWRGGLVCKHTVQCTMVLGQHWQSLQTVGQTDRHTCHHSCHHPSAICLSPCRGSAWRQAQSM